MKEKSLNSHLKPTLQESLWRRLLLLDQLVHVFWDLFVRHLRIDLRAGYGRVPHHLGNALYRYACAERQRPERVTRHVERESLSDATRQPHSAQFVVHRTAATAARKDKAVTFLFHRLFLLASAKDRLRDRM